MTLNFFCPRCWISSDPAYLDHGSNQIEFLVGPQSHCWNGMNATWQTLNTSLFSGPFADHLIDVSGSFANPALDILLVSKTAELSIYLQTCSSTSCSGSAQFSLEEVPSDLSGLDRNFMWPPSAITRMHTLRKSMKNSEDTRAGEFIIPLGG